MSVHEVVESTVRNWSDLPRPRGWPLLGQLPLLKPLRTHLQFEAWARELGTPYRLDLGPGLRASVWNDFNLLQQVSRERPHAFTRGVTLLPVFSEMGINGLFSVEGQAWHAQRRLIMQALSSTHVRGWFGILHDITLRFLRVCERAADAGTVVEMSGLLKRYTVDVTSALAFGDDPRTLENDDDPIQHELEVIFPAVMRRAINPVPYWRWFKLPADRRLDRALARVHAYARNCIARARQRLAADATANETPGNALEAMLLRQQEQGLSEADIVANVVTLLLAGEDTTAHSLAWTLPFLCADPALQAHMADRAQRALGDAPVCPDADVLQALDDFEPLALEALRFRPVVPFNSFTAIQDTVLGGVKVPARTVMFFLKRPAMQDPANFEQPQRYDPERWRRDRREGGSAHEARAFVQFGAGPRVCPGRHLATVEMRLVLSTLLRHFELELAVSPDQIEEVNAFTVMPDRMPVRLRRRGAAAAAADRPGH